MDKRSQWKFETTEGGWTWAVSHPDGMTETSRTTWPTLKACVENAASVGYVAWKPEEERRLEQQLAVANVLRAHH